MGQITGNLKRYCVVGLSTTIYIVVMTALLTYYADASYSYSNLTGEKHPVVQSEFSEIC